MSTPLVIISRESLYIFVCIGFVVSRTQLDIQSNHQALRRLIYYGVATHLVHCVVLNYAFSSIKLPHNKRRFNSSLLPLNSTIIYFYPNIIKKI